MAGLFVAGFMIVLINSVYDEWSRVSYHFTTYGIYYLATILFLWINKKIHRAIVGKPKPKRKKRKKSKTRRIKAR